MNIGMLWYDNDPKADLNTKIERAARYYSEKYRKAPSIVYVHPKMAPNGSGKQMSGRIEVRTSPAIMPNHFWIGVGGKPA